MRLQIILYTFDTQDRYHSAMSISIIKAIATKPSFQSIKINQRMSQQSKPQLKNSISQKNLLSIII